MTRPAVISYVATFLKPEMLHVYRQVCGVRNFENWVVTRRRSGREQFPYEKLIELRKSAWRGIRRLAYRALGRIVPLAPGEVAQILAFSKQCGARLVHVYFGSEALRALPYLKREKLPKIVSFHGADLSHSMGRDGLAQLLGNADLFLARSQSLVDELVSRGCPPERIRLNRTSVPIPPEPECARWRVGQTVRVLQACRFIPKKGLDITIRAVAQLAREGMDIRLDLAGSGPEQHELERLVASEGIGDRVRFLGFLDNQTLLRSLREYTLFAHPSRVTATGDREGIPNAMLEAMAAGLPVVATAHSGIPEAIEDGVEGRLVGSDDAGAVARAIRDIAGDAERWHTFSQAARRRIESDFSAERAIADLEASYATAIRIGEGRCRHHPQG